MLQQTSPGRVLGPYGASCGSSRPLELAPGPRPGTCVRAWAGLGYNRRARQSPWRRHRHRREDTAESVPADLDELCAPARYRAVHGAGRSCLRLRDATTPLSTSMWPGSSPAPSWVRSCRRPRPRRSPTTWCPRGQGWLWNQSLMEIGAVVCGGGPRRATAAAWPPTVPGRAPGGPTPDPACTPPPPERLRPDPTARVGVDLSPPCVPDPYRPDGWPAACGWPDDTGRARRVADALVVRRPGPAGHRGVAA